MLAQEFGCSWLKNAAKLTPKLNGAILEFTFSLDWHQALWM